MAVGVGVSVGVDILSGYSVKVRTLLKLADNPFEKGWFYIL